MTRGACCVRSVMEVSRNLIRTPFLGKVFPLPYTLLMVFCSPLGESEGFGSGIEISTPLTGGRRRYVGLESHHRRRPRPGVPRCRAAPPQHRIAVLGEEVTFTLPPPPAMRARRRVSRRPRRHRQSGD